MDVKRKKIDFLSEDSNTNETIALSNAFIMYVKKNFFVHINDVSFKLVKIYYLRMIDDIFLIGKHNKYEPDAFDSFKNDLNKQCKLN